MKLIIDIPKGEYDKICKTMLHTSSGNPNFYFESKIANGIPLDKITAEIYEHFMTIDGGVHDASAIKCIEIIDKYKGDKE